MLLGEYKHTVDPKGRVAVPAKFRTLFEQGAIVTRGLEHCLFVFGMKEWELLVGKITALPLAQANARAFGRLMLAGAVDVQLDAQGRVLLPSYLREYAGLKKNVTIAGLHSRAEIWDTESWEAYKSKTESQSDDIAERLGSLGI